MKLELGMCGGPEMLETVRDIGFDFLEVNASAMAKLGEAEFEAQAERLLSSGLPVRTSNIFFPGEMKLLGPERDLERIAVYTDLVMSRMKRLGVELMVLGSGGSRRIPDGLSYAQAIRELAETAQLIGEKAETHDLEVVIEPLNPKECNVFLTLGEVAAFTALVNHPRIGHMADIYHMQAGGEPLSEIQRLGPVGHIHIASPERFMPTGESDIAGLVDILTAVGYQGRVSIEARAEDFEKEARQSLETFRRLTEPAAVNS